jgi:DNA transformation protein and related proteins
MSDFVEHLKGVFGSVGRVQVRRMFGGYGLYCNDVMFGLVADDTLYLKSDETTETHFTSRGLTPFRYSSKDRKAVTMSYYLAPEEVLEDPEQAATWARRSYEAALRARNKPRKKRPQR